MKKYIRTLQSVEVFDRTDANPKVIKTFEMDELIPFNREKRRGGINWMEIYLENNQVAYVKKDRKSIYECKYVELSDEKAFGFSYELTQDKKLPLASIFTAVEKTTQYSKPKFENGKGQVLVKRMIDEDKNKMEFIMLEYKESMVDVIPFSLNKKNEFYVIYSGFGEKQILMEIDDFSGRKGFILNSTDITETKDKWLGIVAIIIALATVVAIIIGFFAAGWIVVGGILIIPGMIVAFIVVAIIQIALSILRGVFHQIYKRL